MVAFLLRSQNGTIFATLALTMSGIKGCQKYSIFRCLSAYSLVVCLTFFAMPAAEASWLNRCVSFMAKMVVKESVQPGLDERIDELQNFVELGEYSQSVFYQARGVIRYDEFLALSESASRRVNSNSYLLGPNGEDYKALVRNSPVKDFFTAFFDIGMSAFDDQTETYVTAFLNNLLLQGNRQVFFLLPSDLSEPGKTVKEFEILAADPGLISKVTFIYGPRGFHTSLP